MEEQTNEAAKVQKKWSQKGVRMMLKNIKYMPTVYLSVLTSSKDSISVVSSSLN